MTSILYRKGTQRLIDAGLCALAWVAAFQIRFDGQFSATQHRQLLGLLVPLAIGQLALNTLFGIYRLQWRYVSAGDAFYLTRAYLVQPLVLLGLRLLFAGRVPLLNISAGVLFTFFVLSLGATLGARVLRRLTYQRSSSAAASGMRRRFLLVGAGMHGATVAHEMLLRKSIHVIGFVDDDPEKQGAVIAGVRVLGRTADVPRLVTAHEVDEVLVCVPPESRLSLHLTPGDDDNGVRSRIIPTLEELLESRVAPATPALLQATRAAVNDQPHSEGSKSATTSASPAKPLPVSPGSDAGNRATSKVSAGPGSRRYDRDHPTSSIPGNAPASLAPTVRDKTILITGGAGFIGSSLAEELADHNRIVLLDQCFQGRPIQYTSLPKHPNVTAVEGDIMRLDLESLVRETQVVVHAAAILGVSRVCSSGRETLETNYVGTSRLLKALDGSRSVERFVYFSTSEVFGVNSYRVNEASCPSVGPIAESRWSYAMSKLAGEHLVASYFRETQLPTAIVRPFNIFGPRRTGDYVLHHFIANALRNEPLIVHGDGAQIRSWCYINDLCAALLQMIATPDAIGEDFNIGNPGNTLTVYELARKVIELTSSSSPIEFCESPFPDISIRVPSLDKARRLLGYEPAYDLNTGLELTIAWHREHLKTAAPRAVPAVQSSLLLKESAA